MIDFSKKLGAKPKEKKINPVDIYIVLIVRLMQDL